MPHPVLNGAPAISDPLWYKDAIIYQLHVRSFFDGNADGIGDFAGLTQKLPYLQELGVNTLWILPFYPSPLRDDGYDIAEYYSVNPMYGSLEDFQTFLNEAHGLGLRVITELVINHTSDQHSWFQRARRAAPGSRWRDFYVWSDSPEKYREARIIFRDFEPSNWTWDPVARAYFWHRFYFHQPDLNFDNPEVHAELLRILDFWLDMGVDGLRLDAIPYLYEREGTSCENLPETHEFLKMLRRHVDEKYGDRMLLAEANQWPEDAVNYFGSGKGDECHMAFHFPVMPRLFMGLRMEDRVPVTDILDQTPPIPETSQWAIFLRNHDELTLEMVTDEERDYMYRVYAADARARINLGIRRRLAPLLGNDRRKLELLNLLLLSLPGTPVIYYGDEIGMGDNIFLGDRNGVRTPMHWNSDKNAGFSKAHPHALFLPVIVDPEFHYETTNVETQQRSTTSLLWWTRHVLALRKSWKAFGRGSIRFLNPENRKVLAFVREFEGQSVLVVANLSRFAQSVNLGLSGFEQFTPVELFGQSDFPRVTNKPYLLTLSPYAVFWFFMRAQMKLEDAAATGDVGEFTVNSEWNEIFQGRRLAEIDALLPGYLPRQRWFAGKGKHISRARLRELVKMPPTLAGQPTLLAAVAVEYRDADPEEYLLPLTVVWGKEAGRISQTSPSTVLAKINRSMDEGGESALLCDAMTDRGFVSALARRALTVTGDASAPMISPVPPSLPADFDAASLDRVTLGKAEQSNSSAILGDRFFLKLFRRMEPGRNPDLETGVFLTEKNFSNTPRVVGALEYRESRREPSTIAIITEMVPAVKDGWEHTLDSLDRYLDRVLASGEEAPDLPSRNPLDLARDEIPESFETLLGAYLHSARLLGTRTGEMHRVLGSDPTNPAFAPEPYTPFSQRSLYQSMRNVALRNLSLLRAQLGELPEDTRQLAERVLSLERTVSEEFRAVYHEPSAGMRIRGHGDYHLGQVLYTGKDFLIIDFEGEPARSIGERRIKRTPLRDVAGMVRSFHYASHAASARRIGTRQLPAQRRQQVSDWSRFWFTWMTSAFLRCYLQAMQGSNLLPKTDSGIEAFLRASVLEKALYEVGYELNSRPLWTRIPLEGILQFFELEQAETGQLLTSVNSSSSR
jgi:maltose alpha-D-glucosyltransferase/alpha-amylase